MAVPPYPVMNALTAELRRVGAARGESDLMSLWCGQGVALASELPAAELVGGISDAAGLLLERLGCATS